MFFLLACAAPDPTPAAALVGAAAPIGYLGSIATRAVATSTMGGSGEAWSCVEVTPPCTDDPCSTVAAVTVDATCPLPVAPHATGKVAVGGLFATDTSVLGAVFDLDTPLWVKEVTAFSTSVADDEALLVAYAMEGVTFDGVEEDVTVNQTGFVVRVEDAGTPDDFADDAYVVDGGAQIVKDDGVWQVALTGVRVDAACPANPTDGFATVEDVSQATGGLTTYTFHAACDGTADVLASAGRGAAWSGTSVEFALLP